MKALLVNPSASVISLLEAAIAGAILVVIAATMLPAVDAKGGSILVLATLFGCLGIIAIVSLAF